MSVVCCLRLCMNSSKFLLEMNESKGSGNENKSCMTFAELNICATAVICTQKNINMLLISRNTKICINIYILNNIGNY